MKRAWCFILASILLCSCGGKKNVDYNVNNDGASTEVTAHDTVAADTAEVSDTTKKSLNDIRFAGWTEKEWLDNEYIRTLRRLEKRSACDPRSSSAVDPRKHF